MAGVRLAGVHDAVTQNLFTELSGGPSWQPSTLPLLHGDAVHKVQSTLRKALSALLMLACPRHVVQGHLELSAPLSGFQTPLGKLLLCLRTAALSAGLLQEM